MAMLHIVALINHDLNFFTLCIALIAAVKITTLYTGWHNVDLAH